MNNLILVIGGVFNNKPHLTVMFSDTLVKDFGLHAGQIVKDAAQEIKGGGGGQPFSQLPEDQILRGLVKLWKERRN